jgi:hypothetical protein
MLSVKDDLLQFLHRSTDFEQKGTTWTLEKTGILYKIPWMNVCFWKRHGYNHADIELTLRQFRSFYLWPTAMTFGIELDSSAVKPAYAAANQMIWGAKQSVIKHIMMHVRDTLYPEGKDKPSVLYTGTEIHRPYLPVHRIAEDTWQFLQNLMPKEEWTFQNTHLEQMFEWRGVLCIPIRLERANKLLLMNRILPASIYLQLYGKPQCMALEPRQVWVAGQHYYLTEEAWFFTLQEVSLQKKQKTKKCKKEF